MTSAAARDRLETREIRRARPALGTIVEITITDGSTPAAQQRAFSGAFGAIEKVQQLMSFHEPQSELSRLNSSAHLAPMRVSEWTWEVLRFAQALSAESEGAFDATVASRLETWGYLPRVSPSSRHRNRATWQAVALLPKRQVAFHQPLHLDLGGIAKGFAVDRAVEALRRAGITAGLVNAGGDLRAFGDRDWPVQIRHPANPAHCGHRFALNNAALATSATTYTRKRWRGHWVCALVDGATRRSREDEFSVSVHAPTALTADALTKIVAARPQESTPLLQRHAASALFIDREGAISWTGC